MKGKPELNETQEEFAALMAVAKWSAAETARQLGFTPSAVSQILSGKNTPASQTMQLLRRMVLDLEEKRGPGNLIALTESAPAEKGKMAVRPEVLPRMERAPVISWASAGHGGNYSDMDGFLDDWVETDCRDPNKYALIVEGDSMEPVYRPGDRIVIAPNEEAQNGDTVVARLKESGQVLFKVYHETSKGHVRLTSYNHQMYPPIERRKAEFRFIQPVYQMTRRTLKRGGMR